MNPRNDLLDHAIELFPPPDRSFDRLTRRRDRRRRNRRIAAGLLAVVVATAAIGGALYAIRPRGETRPASSLTIDPSNAAGLHLAWTADVGDAPKGSGYGVAFAGGLVVVQADGLYAFSADCGTDGSSCDPAWVAPLPAAGTATVQPAVADNMVYVASGDVYAFQADCGLGGVTCSPAWIGHPGSGEASQPVVVDGVVYAGSTDGRIYAFAADCGQGGVECQPIWAGDAQAGPSRVVAVSDGVVYSVSGTTVSAFPTACQADCRALWTASIDGATAVSLTASPGVLYVGVQRTSGPQAQGTISAYEASCGIGPSCRPLWTAEVGGYPTSLVYAQGAIYAYAGGTTYPFSEAAFSADSGSLLWSACSSTQHEVACGLHGVSPSMPVAEDGLIWIAHARGTTAYPLSCGSGGATCDPAWTSEEGFFCPGYYCASKAGLAASSTLVVRASGDGVFAFALGSAS